MTSAQICIMISIVLYLSAMVIVGAVYSKKTKNVGDFYLGGRKLGPLVTLPGGVFFRHGLPVSVYFNDLLPVCGPNLSDGMGRKAE